MTLIALISGCASRPHFERLPAEGAPVPTFDLPTLDGSRLTPAALAGQPTVLALWSTDCGASRAALKALGGIADDYAAKGVRMVIVADDSDSTLLRRVIDSAGVRVFAVAFASGKLNATFDDTRRFPWQKSFPLPSYLVIDSGGTVAGRDMGVPLDEVQRRAVTLQNLRGTIDKVLVRATSSSSSPTG